MSLHKSRSLLSYFTTALAQFQSSRDQIRILTTLSSSSLSQQHDVPSSSLSQQHGVPSSPGLRSVPGGDRDNLTILDSSFNPPTVAHASMLLSALRAVSQQSKSTSRRVLLLLSVRNADKEAKPASFPMRLCMMETFGRQVLRSMSDKDGGSTGELNIDLGVTTLPYFPDKRAAIASMEGYPSISSDGREPAVHTYLAGFDTLLRIFNPKYYPAGMKTALGPFFQQARLRVTVREDDEWGGREEQVEYLRRMENGELEALGGVREWIEKIDLVDDAEGQGVSSSLVRERVGNGITVRDFVGEEVARIIEEEHLYQDEKTDS